MAKNREASQFNSLVNVNDTTGQVGIANSVGINTTTPQGSYALYVPVSYTHLTLPTICSV